MTYANIDVSYIVGDIDMSCFAKSASFAAECAVLDTTALCTTGWTTAIAGLRSATFSAELMASMTDLGPDATMWSNFANPDVPQSLSIGSADGSPTYFLRGMATSYVPLQGAPGELAMASVSGQSSTGPLVRGLRIHPPSAVRTTTGNGTSWQLGAVSASQTMHVALHVLERTGTASMTLSVQSDDNAGMTSPTNRITSFTAATARGHQWRTAAGAITDNWWRAVYTITGTGSIRFAVSAGIVATAV